MNLEVHTIDKVKAVFCNELRFLKLLAKDITKRSLGNVFISSLLQLFSVSPRSPCMMFQAELVIGVPSANVCKQRLPSATYNVTGHKKAELT
jgi:hypothetical protein